MKRMKKKGSIVDLVYMAIILFFFAMVVLVGLKIGGAVKDNIVSTASLDATGTTAVESTVSNYTYTINGAFMFLMIFMVVATLALAALVRVHPIFIPFFFLGWIFIIFLCGIFSNVYTSMAEDPNFVSTASNLLIITGILRFLPLIIGVIGIVLMVVMYKVYQNG